MTEEPQNFGIVTPTSERGESYAAGTVYDDLRTDLSQDVEVEPLDLDVPNRPGYQMVYMPDIDFDLLKMWIKASEKRRRGTKKTDMDPMTFSFQVMSNKCIGLKKDGQEVVAEDGDSLTFVHPDLQKLLGALDVQGAIRKMYGSDGHIIQTSQKIIEAAGYTDIDIESGDNPLM